MKQYLKKQHDAKTKEYEVELKQLKNQIDDAKTKYQTQLQKVQNQEKTMTNKQMEK
jgi:hypothetical protein